MLRAFDAKTGKVVWETRLNSGVTGVPSSYMVDGVQYIAVQAGGASMPNACSAA